MSTYERRPLGDAAEAAGPAPMVLPGIDIHEHIEWVSNGATIRVGRFPVAEIVVDLADGVAVRINGESVDFQDALGLWAYAGAEVTITGRLRADTHLRLRGGAA